MMHHHIDSNLIQPRKASEGKSGAETQLEGNIILHGRAQVYALEIALETVVGDQMDTS